MVNKIAQNGQIAGQLRMKRGGQHVSLFCRDDVAVDGAENFCLFADMGNPWRADEDQGERFFAHRRNDGMGGEAVDLAAVGVAADGDVHDAEMGCFAFDFLGQQNQSGTSAPDGHAVFDALTERFHQAEDGEQFGDGGAFTAGDNQGVDLV